MVIFFATFISDIQTLPCLIGYYISLYTLFQPDSILTLNRNVTPNISVSILQGTVYSADTKTSHIFSDMRFSYDLLSLYPRENDVLRNQNHIFIILRAIMKCIHV